MIESHLGHHSDTDMESVAIADDQQYETNWSRNGNDAGPPLRGRRSAAKTDDNLSQLLDQRQQLEVCDALHVF